MPSEEPQPIGESVEQVLLRILDPSIADTYSVQKKQHRGRLKEIERRYRQTLAKLLKWRDRPRQDWEPELQEERAELIRQEEERFRKQLQNLLEWAQDNGIIEPGDFQPR